MAEAAVVVTGTRIHRSLEALASIAAGVEFVMWFPGSAEHAVLLRDIFGNPFRPVAFDPSWGSSAALGLAWSMYESRDFAAMPILADALEESGCESADILSHCRGPGPHVRGCWVVDLVLGKS